MPAFLDDPEEHNPQSPKIGRREAARRRAAAVLVPVSQAPLFSTEDVLHTLSGAMSLLRRCRVNAALTIQLFSQLFHFINMWLFNKLVTDADSGLCCHYWGAILRQQLSHIEAWAEKQGLELAADCHLSRIVQVSGGRGLRRPDGSVAPLTGVCPPGHHPADHEQVLQGGCAAHPQHLLQAELAAAPCLTDQLPLCSGGALHPSCKTGL